MSNDRPIDCCACLRTKSMYFEPDERPGRLRRGDDTSVFWCVVTQSPAGPDGDAAEPDLCQPGRSCFKAP